MCGIGADNYLLDQRSTATLRATELCSAKAVTDWRLPENDCHHEDVGSIYLRNVIINLPYPTMLKYRGLYFNNTRFGDLKM